MKLWESRIEGEVIGITINVEDERSIIEKGSREMTEARGKLKVKGG